MKLAALYNVFDGLELLDASIRSVRSAVDGVYVSWQERSHYGDQWGHTFPAAPAVVPDDVTQIEFKPEPWDGVDYDHYHREAARKRTELMRWAEEDGYTHVLHMDVDEFYHAAEIQALRVEIERHGWTATFCPVQEYRFKPEWQATDLEDFFVPVIMRSCETVVFEDQPFFCSCDPSRRVWSPRPCVLAPGAMLMHHMTSVRKGGPQGLMNKLWNSPERRRGADALASRCGPPAEYPASVGCRLVENVFGIDVD